MPAHLYQTPYGDAAFEVLRGVVAEAQQHDPMAHVTIVVPDNVTGLSARRRVARGTGTRTGIAAITVTTVDRLAEMILAGTAPRRPATASMIAATWRSVLSDDRGQLASVAMHPATVRAVVRADRELRRVDDDALDALESVGGLVSEVTRLHRRVQVKLSGFSDTERLLAEAAGAVTGSDLGRVVVFLPQRLRPRQLALLAAIANAGELGVVAGVTGDARADRAPAELAAALGLGALDTSTPATAGRIVHASDSDDEVRWVVRDILRSLGEKPGHRIAALYSTREPYARLLHDHLTEAGIAVNGPGARPLAERPMPRAFLGLLRLDAQGFPRAQVFNVLSSAPFLTADGGFVPVSRWERISREAGVVGGDDWTTRIDAYVAQLSDRIATLQVESTDPDRDRSRIARDERRRDAALALRDHVQSLRGRFADARTLTSWTQLSDWGIELVEACFGPLDSLLSGRPERQYEATAIELALRTARDLDEVDAHGSLDGLHDVLTAELESARESVGRFGEGVYVGSIDRAHGVDVDKLYVVGVAEDALPGRIAPDPVLPDSARALTGGAIPLQAAVVDDRRRQLLAGLAAGATITFPRGDLRRNAARLPSRWLLPSLQQLAGDFGLEILKWEEAASEHILAIPSSWNELVHTSTPATEQEWRVRALASGEQLTDAVRDVGIALVEARQSDAFTRFDGDLRGMTGLTDYTAGERAVAPTTLEGYADCPHAYFVQRVLGVRPIDLPEEVVTIQPIDSGNLIHHTLDRLVTELAAADELPDYGEPWTDAHRIRIAEIAREEGEHAEARGLTGHPLLWRRELALILDDLDAMLVDDSQSRAETGAAVLSSELRFGQPGGRDPVEVSLEDGRIVLMAGSADKVDRLPDGSVIVIDVKTGSTRRFAAIRNDPIVGGTKLQLPVYALAAQREYAAPEATALYWFVRKERGERIRVVLDEQTRTRFTAAVGVLVDGIAKGLYPPRPPDKPDYAFVSCPFCNPDGIGHVELRASYERKRNDPALATLRSLIDPALDAGGDDE